jgi:hypothetical protein
MAARPSPEGQRQVVLQAAFSSVSSSTLLNRPLSSGETSNNPEMPLHEDECRNVTPLISSISFNACAPPPPPTKRPNLKASPFHPNLKGTSSANVCSQRPHAPACKTSRLDVQGPSKPRKVCWTSPANSYVNTVELFQASCCLAPAD